MKLSHALAIATALAALTNVAPQAQAQRGGDSYSVRRFFGNDSYLLESFPRPKSEASRSTGINPAARQPVAPQPIQPPVTPQPPTFTSSTTNALNFYGGAQARQTLSQMPRRPRFIPQGGQPVGAGVKPYENATADSTLSPYLNLFRDEQEDELPNYFTFVRPYQRQRETNRQQNRQLQRLQGQVQRTAYQAPASGGVPPTGFRARFGDTGQYYNSWRQ